RDVGAVAPERRLGWLGDTAAVALDACEHRVYGVRRLEDVREREGTEAARGRLDAGVERHLLPWAQVDPRAVRPESDRQCIALGRNHSAAEAVLVELPGLLEVADAEGDRVDLRVHPSLLV